MRSCTSHVASVVDPPFDTAELGTDAGLYILQLSAALTHFAAASETKAMTCWHLRHARTVSSESCHHVVDRLEFFLIAILCHNAIRCERTGCKIPKLREL